jgi:hypothetical protein
VTRSYAPLLFVGVALGSGAWRPLWRPAVEPAP